MTKVETALALVRSFTRSFLVVALLAALAYAVLFSPSELISTDVRSQILGSISTALGSAIVFYFKKDEEHQDVEKEEKEVPRDEQDIDERERDI